MGQLYLRNPGKTSRCEINSCVLPLMSEAKCLGLMATMRDLMATKLVIENSKKKNFHCVTIGTFQGELNPLSDSSIIKSCVMSVLLSGYEFIEDRAPG